MQAEITQRLYKEAGVSELTGMTLAILLGAAILATGESDHRVYMWLGLVIPAYVFRTVFTSAFNKNGFAPTIDWLNRFRILTTLTSIVWSTASLFLFLPNNTLNQSIILFTLTGLLAGAALSYAVDIITLICFFLPILIVLISRLIYEATTTTYVMSSMVLLFLIFILASGRRMHKTLHENIYLAKTYKDGEEREKSHGEIMEMLANRAPLSETLEAIVTNLEKQNPKMLCSILLLDPDGKHLLHGSAPSLPESYNLAINGITIGHGVGSCGTAAFTAQRIIVEDIQSHPYWVDYKELAAKASLAACWSEPIKDSSGKVLGSFAIYHREPTIPTEKDIKLILQNAYLAGMSIEMLRNSQEQLLAAMLFDNSHESMIVTDADQLTIAVNSAFENITGYSAKEAIGKNPNILKSGRHDNDFYQELQQQLKATGKWQGEIWNRKKDGSVYAEWLRVSATYKKDGTVLNYIGLSTDVTKRKESEEIIWRQANFDMLTGLPNRHMFHDRITQEIKKTHRAKLPLALLFVDLDHFKEVNDTLGHPMGDLLLKEAAARLVSCVRDSDTVAHMNPVSRLGGDEFTIVLGELRELESVERIAQRVLSRIAEPFQLGEEIAYVSASVGITMYPTDSMDVDTLIKNADQAMYAAKQQGRNRFCYFTESMQALAQDRMRLANDLRSALKNKQFHILYQPIIDLATGKIQKAEALIRWQHPSKGLISPAEFIPIAEDTGLIVDIGNWVFQEAANQVALWRKSLHPDFQISINKSPVQFYNATSSKENTHVNWVHYLEQLGLPGQSITVEITERLLLDTSNTIRSQLLEFRDAGMQVSLDDFGTGYSSMSYLKKFDIDYIKIDQSFVQNLDVQSDDLALCEAIIVMAHKLNLKVVAEGVETQQQLDLLNAAGCDFGQGYFFSRPIPVEEFQKLVN